jgi:hypothetical protein
MTSTKKPSRGSRAKQFAQIERISIAGITEGMGPLGLHTYAEAYLNAVRSLPLPSVPFEPVRPFLVCHSIELGLKAFLSLQGLTILEMADGPYGHNLESILQQAEGKNLAASVKLTKEQRAEIRSASRYYAGKVFEYPAVGEAISGYPGMPTIETLLEAATMLVDSLRQQCSDAK